MKIHESAENYLETILVLSKRQPYVRSIDIANELEFSKPSVSVAMKNLRQNGYITVDDAGAHCLNRQRKTDCRYHLRTPHHSVRLADHSRG